MPRPNKEKCISEILLELEKGSERGRVVSKYSKRFQKSERTIDTYIKEAKKRIEESNEAIQEKIQSTKEAAALEKFEKLYLDKNKHTEELIADIDRLSEIKAGKALQVGGQLIVATFADELRAKAEIRNIRTQIGKWYGFEAPKKLDHTSKGKSINQPQMQRVRVVIKEK